MLKKFLILAVIGGLLALTVAAQPSQMQPVKASQTVKLFAVSRQGGGSTNEIYRYEISGPTDFLTSPELIITDPSFDNIYGLAFSLAGELFVTNVSPAHNSGSISRLLDPTGSPTSNGTITSSDFVAPIGAIFRESELFIAQQHGNNVLRFVFDTNGNASFNGAITVGLCCSAPRGVAVSLASGELFVTQCCGVNAIHRYLFDGTGNAISNGVITGGGLDNPHDIVFSPWGEIFVANTGNSISRFILDGAGNASPNGQITGNGLNGPIGLDFSPWGELFASNHFGSGEISRWTFDASHNAIPNGSFPTPNTLADIQFFSVDDTGTDTTPPEITPNVICDNPGNSPWCKGAITISWTVTDPESAIISTSDCETTTINNDTPSTGTTLTCTATSAGGTSSKSETLFRDGTAPLLAPNPTLDTCSLPGNAGWCRGTQMAGFSASDTTSGVASPCAAAGDASCAFIQSTTTDGSAVNVASGVVCDLAGNCDPGLNAGPYMIDDVAPSITPGTPPTGSPYQLNQPITPSFTCTDNVSGFASSSGLSTSGPNGADCTGPGSVNTSASGPQSYGPLVATDIAGNSATSAGVAYNVIHIIYLHGAGPNNNPPTLFLDNIAPAATTAKYKDSSNVNFNGGNPWKDIGAWAANPTLAAGILNVLNDLHVWLGLKNSDDQGAKFDLRAEIYKNGTLVASDETYCIAGITRNAAQAKEAIISFGSFSPIPFDGTSDVLSLKIQTRIGTDGAGSFCGGHSNAVGLRLYFDATSRPSRFNAGFEQ